MDNIAKKLKTIVKGVAPKSTFGTDPNEPWSAKAGITEGALDQYLMARGINPKFVSTQTKISHSKSSAFLKWKQDHVVESVDKKDTVTMDIPLLIRVLELAREDIKSDMDLHRVVEKLINIRDKGMLTMDDYDYIAKLKEDLDLQGELTEEMIDELKKSTVKSWLSKQEVVPPKKPGMDRKAHNQRIKSRSKSWDRALDRLTGYRATSEEVVDEAKKPKPTALEKWRKASDEREKKHNELEKKPGAVERLEKHLNKEESSEFMKDVKKKVAAAKSDRYTHYSKTSKDMPNTADTYAQMAQHQKKLSKEETELEEAKHYPNRYRATYHDPDTDKMTHVMDFNHKSLEAAKKHAEGSRLQRKDGKEDKLHSVEQIKEESVRKKEMSKSARMIKALYKRKGVVKEDLYDHEKEDKPVTSYGKPPKMSTQDSKKNVGDKAQAAAVLTGGKTLTGQTRDTLEIDPIMRKAGPLDQNKKI
jgi:hypothetical protein